MKKSGALWLIAIGGFFLASQLGYISYGIGGLIRTFWPCILILIGLSQLLESKKHSSSSIGHIILVVIGGYFQARNLGINVVSPGEFFKFLFPAALIFGGIYALVKPKRSPIYPPTEKETSTDMYNKDYHYPPTPPVPPAPIEPLESPLDRMFVNLEKDDFKASQTDMPKSESKRYDWEPESHAEREWEERKRQTSSSEFHKIGEMARDIGKQTTDQVRKIDFSRIADEVKSEVDSAMKDLKKSMKSEHGKGKVSLEKDPFSEDFADGGRFYEGCGEEANHRFGGYDKEAMRKTRQKADKEKKEKMVNESSFIGDYYIGRDYFRLKPMNVSHFVGDTVIDLTKAQIPYGTTKINISSFIGDVVIYMPNDPEVGVKVHSSSFLGDQNILGNRTSGMAGGVDETYNYEECAKRIKINISSFISDVNVNIVG
ncbi:hypothetical protein B9G55_15685 [Saccharibacillus sp. O16]|nr:hypothetical protein B9G55_15685 [Saccharibacillus sp. O16]